MRRRRPALIALAALALAAGLGRRCGHGPGRQEGQRRNRNRRLGLADQAFEDDPAADHPATSPARPGTTDGSHVPAAEGTLRRIRQERPRSTPRACRPAKSWQLENTLTAEAKRKCKEKALVGKGSARELAIDFPDQDPFDAPGPLLAFNGKPKGGKQVLLLHVFAHVPAPTTFVVPGDDLERRAARSAKKVLSKDPADRGWQRRADGTSTSRSTRPGSTRARSRAS